MPSPCHLALRLRQHQNLPQPHRRTVLALLCLPTLLPVPLPLLRLFRMLTPLPLIKFMTRTSPFRYTLWLLIEEYSDTALPATFTASIHTTSGSLPNPADSAYSTTPTFVLASVSSTHSSLASQPTVVSSEYVYICLVILSSPGGRTRY